MGLRGQELLGRGHQDVERVDVPWMVQVGNLFVPWVEQTIDLVEDHRQLAGYD